MAKHFKYLGSNDYEMRDYQIVNGCQTSNIIYKNKEIIKNSTSVLIPIKIIHTNNGDLISRIIRATNRQTPVPEEAFIALEKFHKRLQEFYSHYSIELPEAIYYERRSKEYSNSDIKIDKARIVNLHSLIRSFASVFLTEPHLVYNNNPTEILRTKSDKFFQEDHSYYPYFVSSYSLFILQKYFDEGKITPGYALFRYYAIMIFRILSSRSFKYPYLNSRDINSYCQKVMSNLIDEKKSLEIFNKSFDIIKKAIEANRSSTNIPVRNIIRTYQFKDSIFNTLKHMKF